MNKLKFSFKKLEALKNNKKISLIIVAGFLAITLIFISELDLSEDEKEKIEISDGTSTSEYCSYLEDKVTEIIESIDGAGKTKVMITLSETTEYIYATNDKDTRKSTDSKDDIAFENDYVIIEENNNDTGLLIKTIEPKVRGIAVVCEGGNNSTVQNQIYSAVSAVLNISSSRISISKLSYMEETK